MKRYFYRSAVAVAAIAVCATACSKKDDGSAVEPQMSVSVATPVIDSVTLTKEYPGHLMARSRVDLVARVNGYLRAKTYESGQYVEKGQVLFIIEDTQYRDAVNQAQAQLNTAIATNQYNTRNYEAMKKALESDAVSQISVIQAESDLKNSQAAIRNAEAALETAKTNLGYCTVRAPFAGHVSASGPDPGAYLSGAGSPVTLATIYDDAMLMAEFNIDDVDLVRNIQQVKRNGGVNYNAVPLTFQEPVSKPYTGSMFYIAPNVDPSTGTLIVRLMVDNASGELKNGMYVTMALPTAVLSDAVLIKDASISTDQAGKYVYVVNDSNRVVYTPIEVGQIVQDSMRVVTKGLTKDSRYVTQALLKVRDGMQVKPVLTK